MESETVEVDGRFGKEFEGTYVFEEITWAQRNRIIQRNQQYHPRTGMVIGRDLTQIQAETIVATLKTQPKGNPITLERLLSEQRGQGIPLKLGELLARAANKVTMVSVEEEGFLQWPSSEDELIQLLERLGFARSSTASPVS